MEKSEISPRNYYGYIRVSTETQSEKGYGLEAQRSEIMRYAAANGITVSQFFEDAGISANLDDDADDTAIGKRTGLMSLLAEIEEGDAVIVLNTSRLWRSDLTKALIRRELIRKKAVVIDLEHPTFDLYKTSKDPAAYLINAITEALDVYDRMNIGLKLSRGRAVKAKGGNKPAGATPYGYQYSADKKRVEICEPEAAAVRMMFSLGQTGMTLSQIADRINESGMLTRHGKPFSKGSIAAILGNRFYLGELSHAGQLIKGNHTPIISKIQFGKVQAQLEKRKK